MIADSERLAVIEERVAAAERAQALQFTEFMRRLGELNGEAGRLRGMQETYLPREVADARHDDVIKSINAINVVQSNLLGRIAVISAIVSAASALIVKWLLP